MIIPLQVTFRDFDATPAIEAYVEKKAAKLDRFFDRITSCRVVLEAPHRHHRHGRRYHVRIDLTVPGEELVVERNPDNPIHEDLYACIDDAFDDAERRLEDYARLLRRDVKPHEHKPRARVAKLFPAEGYGFLETPEGDEVYFHRNSVRHREFERLEVDDEVTYAAEDGDKGPQASMVERHPPR
jgi:ribosomal subunit interface protein